MHPMRCDLPSPKLNNEYKIPSAHRFLPADLAPHVTTTCIRRVVVCSLGCGVPDLKQCMANIHENVDCLLRKVACRNEGCSER